MIDTLPPEGQRRGLVQFSTDLDALIHRHAIENELILSEIVGTLVVRALDAWAEYTGVIVDEDDPEGEHA